MINRIRFVFACLIFLQNQNSIETARNEYISDCFQQKIDSDVTNSVTFVCSNSNSNTKKCSNNFTELSLVGSVHFQNCQMSRIKIDIFNMFTNLKILNISSVELQYLPGKLFEKANNLLTLFASHNRLRKIAKSQFISGMLLSELDFSYNKIESIDEEAFTGLYLLTKLNLSNNQINTLHPNIFEKLPELKVLDLSFNNILRIYRGTFGNLFNLEKLFLEHNNLLSIETGNFGHKYNLELIHVNDNRLWNLIAFKNLSFPSLYLFQISGNNFSCDYLQRFFNGFDHKDVKFISDDAESLMNGENVINGIDCVQRKDQSLIDETIETTTEILKVSPKKFVMPFEKNKKTYIHVEGTAVSKGNSKQPKQTNINHEPSQRMLIILCILSSIIILAMVGVIIWVKSIVANNSKNNVIHDCSYSNNGYEENCQPVIVDNTQNTVVDIKKPI